MIRAFLSRELISVSHLLVLHPAALECDPLEADEIYCVDSEMRYRLRAAQDHTRALQ